MVEIKILDKLERKSGNTYGVERAVIGDIVSRGGAREISNTDSVYAAESDNALYCVAESLSHINDVVNSAKERGKSVVLLLSEAGSCGATYTVFAYLDEMPNLPSGAVDVKRLAPTLAQVVSSAVGMDVKEADKLIRHDGVFGAIVDGKLAGFIGRSGAGGMDIFRLYDDQRPREVGKELVKFLTTLIMTGGSTPFALVEQGDEKRRAILAECGLVEGKLFAYIV